MVEVKDEPGVMIPCWLCGSPVEVKNTKRNKPYLICEGCGLQTFVRHSKAEDLLVARIQEYQKGG
ncbi:MAG: hypothetical protein KAV87_01700 [Desulfobacteraceae bacterium]|nr:hypothetical protein [Desulfobacteraceae bacterium]